MIGYREPVLTQHSVSIAIPVISLAFAIRFTQDVRRAEWVRLGDGEAFFRAVVLMRRTLRSLRLPDRHPSAPPNNALPLGLSSVVKVSPEQLREGVEVLAEMAGILRAVPRAHHPSVAARATVRDQSEALGPAESV